MVTRKEVIVDNKIFDLGLKEFQSAVARPEWPKMEIEICETIFQVGTSLKDRTVSLNWWGLTPFRNIVWTRFVFLKLGRPVIKQVSCFTYSEGRD